jgi:hypothetical protein
MTTRFFDDLAAAMAEAPDVLAAAREAGHAGAWGLAGDLLRRTANKVVAALANAPHDPMSRLERQAKKSAKAILRGLLDAVGYAEARASPSGDLLN